MPKWEEEKKGAGKARGSTNQGMKGIIKTFETWQGKGYESQREKQGSGARGIEKGNGAVNNSRRELKIQG